MRPMDWLKSEAEYEYAYHKTVVREENGPLYEKGNDNFWRKPGDNYIYTSADMDGTDAQVIYVPEDEEHTRTYLFSFYGESGMEVSTSDNRLTHSEAASIMLWFADEINPEDPASVMLDIAHVLGSFVKKRDEEVEK